MALHGGIIPYTATFLIFSDYMRPPIRLAALMGPGPSVARTVPWNKQKTWWGVLGCFVGTWVAFIACFAWPLRGTESLYLANPLGYGAAVAVVIAIVESLVSKVDDNYIVGLGGAAAAWAVVSLLK